MIVAEEQRLTTTTATQTDIEESAQPTSLADSFQETLKRQNLRLLEDNNQLVAQLDRLNKQLAEQKRINEALSAEVVSQQWELLAMLLSMGLRMPGGEVRRRWLTTQERLFFQSRPSAWRAPSIFQRQTPAYGEQRRFGSGHVRMQENLIVRDIDIRNFFQLRNLSLCIQN